MSQLRELVEKWPHDTELDNSGAAQRASVSVMPTYHPSRHRSDCKRCQMESALIAQEIEQSRAIERAKLEARLYARLDEEHIRSHDTECSSVFNGGTGRPEECDCPFVKRVLEIEGELAAIANPDAPPTAQESKP